VTRQQRICWSEVTASQHVQRDDIHEAFLIT
jgi:hypothetical protein